MPIIDSPIIVFCVAFYLVLCVGIGIWSMRRTQSAADFFIAGRQLGIFVVVISAVSTVVSGFAFVGGPGLVFESGFSSLWMTIAVGTFVASISWPIVGKRLRLMAEIRQILTLPEAVAARYGGRAPQLAMAIAIFLGVIGYLGTQVLAIGMVLVAVLGVDLSTAMLIGLSVLAFYSVAGGIIAGVYTDMFQGILMMGASAGILYYTLQLGGGMSNISEVLWNMDPDFIGPWGTRGPITAISWYLLFVVGALGQPHSITKSLMLKNIHDARWSPLLTVSVGFLLPLLWMMIGLTMRYLVEIGAQEPFSNPDLAAPLFLLNHVPEWLAGMVFAGLLAAIMSTADGFLNLGCASVVHDIPLALTGKPLKHELTISRLVTGVILVLSALFALYMENLIALLGTFGWGTFAAAIVPSVALGFNWKRATRQACVSSIAISILLNFSLELMARHNLYALPHGMSIGCFSLLVSLAVFVGVSLSTGHPDGKDLPEDVRAVMEV